VRDIKFRQYYTGDDDSDPEWNYFDLRSGHMTIDGGYMDAQQYTGLTDKNGVEIYEGDIVTFPSKLNVYANRYLLHQSRGKKGAPENIVSLVNYDEGAFTFDSMHGYEGQEVQFEQVAVIGNIYENPELLQD